MTGKKKLCSDRKKKTTTLFWQQQQLCFGFSTSSCPWSCFFMFYESHQFNLSCLRACTSFNFFLLRSDRRHIFFKHRIKQLPEWIVSSSGAASQRSLNVFADRDVCSYVHFLFAFVFLLASRSVPRCKIHSSQKHFFSSPPFPSIILLVRVPTQTQRAAACGLWRH